MTSYGYDAAGRLASLGLDLAGTASDNAFTFAYDPAGRIRSRTVSNDAYATLAAAGATQYLVNGLNQITDAGAAGLAHDGNGNMTGDGARSYAYSSENPMVSAGTVAFGYDPLGRLARIDGAGDLAGFRLTRDGDDLVAMHRASDGNAQRMVFGPGEDELVAWYPNAPRWFAHQDERGSVIAISDASGDPVRINRYDEYGNPHADNMGWLLYTGQQWLHDVPIYYYNARIYHPEHGRFLQTDPTGYGDGMNMYAYVGSDPMNYSDVTGLERICGGQTRIRNCVFVDGDGDGNGHDNDLSHSVEQLLESAWGGSDGALATYGTISGRDLTAYGKTVNGYGASQDAQAMLRVATQMLGYVISIATSIDSNGEVASQMRDNWARIDQIFAYDNPGRGRAGVELLSHGPGADGLERFTISYYGGFGYGDARDMYASPPDIIRSLLHETAEISFLPWERWTNPNAAHQVVDAWAREHTVLFGFGRCQAIPRVNFAGC